MTAFSTAELMDRLYGNFDVILSNWKRTPQTETHLWELSAEKTTAELLEQDIYDIGQYFLRADEIGTQSEIYLVAECIVYLRAQEQAITSHMRTEEAIETMVKTLLRTAIPANTSDDQLFTPLCFRIAQFAHAQGLIAEEVHDNLRQILIHLANLFLLRDGNYTCEEDARMKEFYATLHQ